MTKTRWKTRIKKACLEAGTYKKCFDAVIDTLAGILESRDMAQDAWDGEILVEHTNKSGNTNIEQSPVLRMINDLNRDALAYWKELGLTPAGLKRINDAAIKTAKPLSALEKALKKMG